MKRKSFSWWKKERGMEITPARVASGPNPLLATTAPGHYDLAPPQSGMQGISLVHKATWPSSGWCGGDRWGWGLLTTSDSYLDWVNISKPTNHSQIFVLLTGTSLFPSSTKLENNLWGFQSKFSTNPKWDVFFLYPIIKNKTTEYALLRNKSIGTLREKGGIWISKRGQKGLWSSYSKIIKD